MTADFYYDKYQYAKSDEMCNNGLKICLSLQDIENEANFYIYKSRNGINTMDYNESLKQLDYAEKLNKLIGNYEFSIMILYHKALTYKKLSQYGIALKYLEILKERFQIRNKKMLLKVKLVYANCLNEQHKFEESEKEYIETLDIAMENDDRDFIALAYKNLSELYFNEKKYKDAAKYIKYSLEYNPNDEYLNEILYFAAKVFKNLSEDVEEYLLQALDICEKRDKENLDLIEKIIYELVLIYIEKEDEENLELVTKKAKELNKECYLIYLKLIEYSIGRNIKKSLELIKESSDKVKKIKKF